MIFKKVFISAIGYDLAGNEVSSSELENRLKPLYTRLGLNHGRLELMTGIKTRRFYDRSERPSSAAYRAGLDAIKRSGIDKRKIGLLVNGSVCRDFLEPATAVRVSALLGLDADTLLFDISNACLGMLNGAIMAANMIELGFIEAALVVAGEMGEKLVDATIDSLNKDDTITRQSLKSSIASLTIGSSAAAILLTCEELSKSTDAHKLIAGYYRSDTTEYELCSSSKDIGFDETAAPLMNTESEKLMMAGASLAQKTWNLFLNEIGWAKDDISKLFTHQVSMTHRKILYDHIDMPIEKDYETVSFLGNVGSVSAPITLGLAADRSVIEKDQKIALLGIGSGLNCLMLGISW